MKKVACKKRPRSQAIKVTKKKVATKRRRM